MEIPQRKPPYVDRVGNWFMLVDEDYNASWFPMDIAASRQMEAVGREVCWLSRMIYGRKRGG
jgi:hypothetical protein